MSEYLNLSELRSRVETLLHHFKNARTLKLPEWTTDVEGCFNLYNEIVNIRFGGKQELKQNIASQAANDLRSFCETNK